jgi:hypothetical protein
MRKKLGKEQREFLEGRFAEWLREQPDALELRNTLLSIAGEAVVAPPNNYESDMTALLQSGRVISGAPAFKEMSDNSCHQNAAKLWRESGQPTFGIGTGFGLNGGLWRQHTWAMDSETIIETTDTREIYFGILYYGADAQRFCQMIAG